MHLLDFERDLTQLGEPDHAPAPLERMEAATHR